LLDNRWFAQAMSIAEEDRELDLDSRFLLGASYGRTFVRSQRMEFAAFAGVNADRERFRGHRADTLFEAHAGVDWEWFELAADTSIDRKSTRLNSSHVKISYAVFCLKKKKAPNGKSP